MGIESRNLYHSSNGDRWCLVRDSGSGRVFVRHKPNLSSGGQAANIEVGDFLVRGGFGPEKQELLRLIGSLVEEYTSNGEYCDRTRVDTSKGER